jgi:hypothetical protein
MDIAKPDITPSSKISWAILALGSLILLLTFWLQLRMWQVEFGYRPVAAGGGEYMIAVFLGLPSLLISNLILGFAAFRSTIKSSMGLWLFLFSILPLLWWIIHFVKSSI